MPVNVIRSQSAYGEVTDPKLGILRVAFPIGERNNTTEVQGNAFIGAKIGAKFHFIYKDVGVGKIQVGWAKEIKDGDVYQLEVSGLDDNFGNTGVTDASFWITQINKLEYAISSSIGSERTLTSKLRSATTPNDMLRMEVAKEISFETAFNLANVINSFDNAIKIKLNPMREIEDVVEISQETQEVVEKIELEKSPVWVKDAKSGLKYWMSDTMRVIAGACKKVAESGQFMNILLKGNSGYGKTSMGEAIAAHLGYKYLRVNCAQMADTVAWFGKPQAKDGKRHLNQVALLRQFWKVSTLFC